MGKHTTINHSHRRRHHQSPTLTTTNTSWVQMERNTVSPRITREAMMKEVQESKRYNQYWTRDTTRIDELLEEKERARADLCKQAHQHVADAQAAKAAKQKERAELLELERYPTRKENGEHRELYFKFNNGHDDFGECGPFSYANIGLLPLQPVDDGTPDTLVCGCTRHIALPLNTLTCPRCKSSDSFIPNYPDDDGGYWTINIFTKMSNDQPYELVELKKSSVYDGLGLYSSRSFAPDLPLLRMEGKIISGRKRTPAEQANTACIRGENRTPKRNELWW